ncbi:MAG: hypothetical protein KDC74_05165 [Flavobacteriaceae bacterium]|nr:hypothetical protein [Flavobacteriaceae bacterium]
MKLYLKFGLFFLLIACSKEQKLNGYYYFQLKSEDFQNRDALIYQFYDSGANIYNFSDSTKMEVTYEMDHNYIKISDDVFKYENVGDTINLTSLIDTTERGSLVKFSFAPINLKSLKGKVFEYSYEMIENKSKEIFENKVFIQLNRNLKPRLFHFDQALKDTLYSYSYSSVEQFYDKFLVVLDSNQSVMILVYYSGDSLKVLTSNPLNRNVGTFTESQIYYDNSSNWEGHWQNTKKYEANNMQIFHMYAMLGSNGIYEDRLDSIHRIYDLERIQILKDSLICYDNEGHIVKRFYLDNDFVKKYFFLDDFYNDNHEEFFTIEKLKNDSLIFHLGNQKEVSYEFIKIP